MCGFVPLEQVCTERRYQSSTPAEAVADITADEAKYFTIIDAAKGYHQCPLDEASQLYTTFITPFGRFKYLRAPYGLSSIAEHYNRRMAEAFEGLTGFRRVVDDVIIYDKDIESHVEHVKQFLQRCKERQISRTKVKFAGFQVSSDGYRIITEALANFPTPANRTDLRSFFGLANQLSSSTDTVAQLLLPLRPLLSTKQEFVWLAEHDQAFTAIKQHLVEIPTLVYFSLMKPTWLCTDASRQGIGFILQQQSDTGQWTLVQAGSAVIELELLAVAWAVIKCKLFLSGLQHFQVVTDHSPLVPILNTHHLDEIENPRLQRLRTRLMAYSFTAEWCKGSANTVPDALSRHPVLKPSPGDALAEQDDEHSPVPSIAEIRTHQTGDQSESVRLQDLQRHAVLDEEYQHLKTIILRGFPDHKRELPESCKQYWQVRHNLTVDDELVVYGCTCMSYNLLAWAR